MRLPCGRRLVACSPGRGRSRGGLSATRSAVRTHCSRSCHWNQFPAQGPGTGSDAAPVGLPVLSVTRAVCSGADSEGSVERLECVPGGVCPGLVSAVPGAPPALGVTGHSLRPVAAPWPWAQTRGAAVPTRAPFPASVCSTRSLLLPAPRTERWSAGRGQQALGPPTVPEPERDQAEGTPTLG